MTPAPLPPVKIGDWDVSVGIIGPKGYGKSTLALTKARELGARGAYVIVHDPKRTYVGADVHRHADERALARALATHPGGLHVLDVPDGYRVFLAAMKVAQASRRARELDGPATVAAAAPVLLVWDEITSVKGVHPSSLDPTLARAYLQARHCHLGFIWLTQYPAMVHPALWDGTSEIVLFKVKPRWFPALENAGCSRELLERARRLRRFETLRYPHDDPDEQAPATETQAHARPDAEARAPARATSRERNR